MWESVVITATFIIVQMKRQRREANRNKERVFQRRTIKVSQEDSKARIVVSKKILRIL